jgi:hypothetical protein
VPATRSVDSLDLPKEAVVAIDNYITTELLTHFQDHYFA